MSQGVTTRQLGRWVRSGLVKQAAQIGRVSSGSELVDIESFTELAEDRDNWTSGASEPPQAIEVVFSNGQVFKVTVEQVTP